MAIAAGLPAFQDEMDKERAARPTPPYKVGDRAGNDKLWADQQAADNKISQRQKAQFIQRFQSMAFPLVCEAIERKPVIRRPSGLQMDMNELNVRAGWDAVRHGELYGPQPALAAAHFLTVVANTLTHAP